MNMFKNKIAPKTKESSEMFKAPSYDNRSGPKVAAGDYYGTGFKQPVGKIRSSTMYNVAPLKAMKTPPKEVV